MVEERFRTYRPRKGAERLSIWRLINTARNNLLELFSDNQFTNPFLSTKVLGRQFFVANRPDLVKHILLTNHKNYEPKSPQMVRALEHLLGDGLFISSGAVWAQRRPLVSPMVHQKNLDEFTGTMVEVAASVTDELLAMPEGEIRDMVDVSARMTAKIICKTIFGRNLSDEHAGAIIDGFALYQKHIDVVNLPYFLGADKGFPVLKFRSLRRATRAVRGSIEKVVEEAQLELNSGDDSSVISMLLEARTDDGVKLTKREIVNEAATLFMAGYETTAATLSWAHYLLSCDPVSEKRLFDELDAQLDGRTPSLEDVPKLKFTRAVIEETLRLYPPVPFLLRQSIDSDEIEGQKIKPKSLVGVSPWLLHRNSEIWEDPDAFVPDRFLQGPIDPFSYLPFARGARICAGAAFGLTEAILCLAVMGQKLSCKMATDKQVRPLCHLTLKPENGLPMHFIARDLASQNNVEAR